MSRRAYTADEWVAELTNWIAEADRIVPIPASSARGRTGMEMRMIAGHYRPAREAWMWMVHTGVVVSEKVYTGHRPRTVWRLT